MREIRPYGSEGGEAQTNGPSLPLSRGMAIVLLAGGPDNLLVRAAQPQEAEGRAGHS